MLNGFYYGSLSKFEVIECSLYVTALLRLIQNNKGIRLYRHSRLFTRWENQVLPRRPQVSGRRSECSVTTLGHKGRLFGKIFSLYQASPGLLMKWQSLLGYPSRIETCGPHQVQIAVKFIRRASTAWLGMFAELCSKIRRIKDWCLCTFVCQLHQASELPKLRDFFLKLIWENINSSDQSVLAWNRETI